MSRPTVLLLHGPNLNLLGSREPEIYRSATLDDHVKTATAVADGLGLDIAPLQSNHEGELIDAIHTARSEHAGIIINPGAFTHSSWAIHDAFPSSSTAGDAKTALPLVRPSAAQREAGC